jgi:hypothetical protein
MTSAVTWIFIRDATAGNRGSRCSDWHGASRERLFREETAGNRGSRCSDWHRASRERLFRDATAGNRGSRCSDWHGASRGRLFRDATAGNRGSRCSDWHRASRELIPTSAKRLLPTDPASVEAMTSAVTWIFIRDATAGNRGSRCSDWHGASREPHPTAAEELPLTSAKRLLPTDLASVEAMTSAVTWIFIRDATAGNQGSRCSDWHGASRELLATAAKGALLITSTKELPLTSAKRLLPTDPASVEAMTSAVTWIFIRDATAGNRGSRCSDWHRASRELILTSAEEAAPDRPCVGRSGDFRGYQAIDSRFPGSTAAPCNRCS